MADSPYLGEATKVSPTSEQEVRLLVSIKTVNGNVREVAAVDPKDVLASGVQSVNGVSAGTTGAITLTTENLEPKGDRLYLTAAQRTRLENLPTVLTAMEEKIAPAALVQSARDALRALMRELLQEDGYKPETGGGTTPTTPTPVTLPMLMLSPKSRTITTAYGENKPLTSFGSGWPSGTVFAFTGFPNDGRVLKTSSGLITGMTAFGVMVKTTITVTATHPDARNSDGSPVVRSDTFELTVEAAPSSGVTYPLDNKSSLTPSYSFRKLATGITNAGTLMRGAGGPTTDWVPKDDFTATATFTAWFETGGLSTFTKDGVTYSYNPLVRLVAWRDQAGGGKHITFDFAKAPLLVRDPAGRYSAYSDSPAVFGQMPGYFPAGGFEKLAMITVLTNSSTLKSDGTGKGTSADNSVVISFGIDGDNWSQGHLDRDANTNNGWRMLAGAGPGYLGSKRNYGYEVGCKFPVAISDPSVVQIGRNSDKRPMFRVNGVTAVTEEWSERGMSVITAQASSQTLYLWGTPNGQRAEGLAIWEVYGTYNDVQDEKLAQRWGASSARALGMTTPDTTANLDAPPEPTPDPYADPVVETLAPAARSDVTTMKLVNKDTGTGAAYTSRAKRVVGFERGAIAGAAAEGVRLTWGGSTANLQQDEETYYNDGSLKQAVVTLRGDLTRNTSTADLAVGCELGAANRTAAVTLANVAANSNFVLRLSGYDLGSDVFEVSVNDIIANGTAWPWGTNPVQGWQQIAKGPLRNEWRFWAMPKRVSDGARHRWLKVVVWLEAYSATEFAIIARVQQSLTTGANPNCTAGEAKQPKHVFVAELLNGGATVYRWGGPQDIRVKTVAASAFDPTTQVISTPRYAPDNVPVVFAAAQGGTLPAGLPTAQPSFISWKNGDNTQARIATSREGAVDQWRGNAWAAGNYGDGAFARADGVVWTTYKQQEWGSSPGTATTKPTGSGATFTDGALVWSRITAGPVTAAGSGDVTIIPLACTYPWCAADLCDMTTRGRIYVGGAGAKPVYAEPNLLYQTVKAAISVPHDLSLEIDAGVLPAGHYWPGQMMNMDRNLNGTGNGAGDERIGYLNHSAALALVRPTDAGHLSRAQDMARSFSGYHLWSEDTLSSLILVGNNGHDRDGVDYPGMKVRKEVRTAPYYTDGAVEAKLGYANRDGYYESYTRYVDGSHLPSPALGTYIVTGDASYLDQMLNQFATLTVSDYQPIANVTINGNPYNRISVVNVKNPGRATGWGTRVTGAAYHHLPANRPEYAYVRDIYLECARYIIAVISTFSAERKALGLYCHEMQPNGLQATIQPWMVQYAYWALGVEAKRAEHPGWQRFIDFSRNFILGSMDAGISEGGCMWFASARAVYVQPHPGYGTNAQGMRYVLEAKENAFHSTWKKIWDETLKEWPAMLTQHNGNGAPDTTQTEYTTCPTTGMLLEYGNIASGSNATNVLACAVIAAWLGEPRAPALITEAKRRLTEANGGTDYRQRLRNYPEHTFDFAA